MQTQQRRPTARPGARPAQAPPAWIAGPEWSTQGLRQPGWLLLPLRGFLAVTFIYAGLQKLANPTYLDPHNRASVVGQMHTLRHTSPIGPLLSLSLHAPTLVGLLIAFGELAVGLGVLIGLWTRLAALGGMLLALTFYLTVSWSTTPYYYCSDIVFLFAWTVFVAFGAGGVLSVDGWLRWRARRLTGIRNDEDALSAATQAEVDRRTVLLGARAAGVVAVAAAATGGFTAMVGRLVGGTNRTSSTALTGRPSPTPSASAASKPAGPAKPAPGTAIGPTTAVPVGQAGQFTDPASGNPGYVVHPTADKWLAFSAVCTHAGCTVQFDPGSMQFVCPCHGGTYDAKTGQVLGGPPPSPLPTIPIHVVNGEIRVD